MSRLARAGCRAPSPPPRTRVRWPPCSSTSRASSSSAARQCTRPIFGPAGRVRGALPAWLKHEKTRFLPEYIRLEVDGEGVPIWLDGHVTDLVARRHVWEE